MKDLKKIIEDLDIQYDVVCEVGVYSPEISQIKDLVPDSKKVIMIEPQVGRADAIKLTFKDYDYVTVHNVAIYKENVDRIKLYCKNQAAFIEGLASPEVVIKKYVPTENDAFYVEAKTFNNYDDGDIDILACDMEGAEWYVIENLISRPKIICLETHYKPPLYINPFMKEINEWMIKNNYEKYCEDTSDTVYLKKK